MLKYIPTSTLLLPIDRIKTANECSLCTQTPATYYEACNPLIWEADKVYSIEDICKAPTDNNMVYECIAGGTSGSSEPAWATNQDDTFIDNTVEWKTHNNYSLAVCDLELSDKTIEDITGGKKLTFGKKIGILTHRAGALTLTVYINSVNKTVEAITTSTTIDQDTNDLLAGRTILINECSFNFAVS